MWRARQHTTPRPLEHFRFRRAFAAPRREKSELSPRATKGTRGRSATCWTCIRADIPEGPRSGHIHLQWLPGDAKFRKPRHVDCSMFETCQMLQRPTGCITPGLVLQLGARRLLERRPVASGVHGTEKMFKQGAQRHLAMLPQAAYIRQPSYRPAERQGFVVTPPPLHGIIAPYLTRVSL